MNKKLLALLLVTAMAVQVKAAEQSGSGSDSENSGSETVIARRSNPSASTGESANNSNMRRGASLPAATFVDSGSYPDATPPRSERESFGRRNILREDAGDGLGTDPHAFGNPVPFEIPGKNDGIVKAVWKRVCNKVWTFAVKGDATQRIHADKMLRNILKDGARNFDRLNASQKATYYNAQDAQYGLKTTRFFKAAKLLIAAGLFKVVRDVIKEDADEDDEDEA